jgi:hypothetical protein
MVAFTVGFSLIGVVFVGHIQWLYVAFAFKKNLAPILPLISAVCGYAC